jgi:thiol:disulfide interchange protein DsbD
MRGPAGCIALAVMATACGKSYVDAPFARWQQDLEAAKGAALAQDKPLLVFFGADWDCSAKELEHKTFADPEVRKLLAAYVTVTVDMTDTDDDPVTLAAVKEFRIVGEPGIVVLAPGLRTELARINEYVPPATFAGILRGIRSDG